MPRIDPLSLLKCLSVLLGPTGGIKSKDEVHRLANLMTKFSKKLVSKCIYIQILKTTNTELLSQFMTAGGWNLVHSWLSDGIVSKNWALLQELLELLLLCPVDIERLKSNNCPKLIKGLSKEAKDLTVRSSAGKLVDQWLKLVKSEVTPHPVTPNIKLNNENEATKNQTITINDDNEQETNVMISKLDDDSDDNDNNINNDATVQMNDLELKNNCVELVDTNNINDEQDNNNDEEVVEEEKEEEVEDVEKNLQEYQNVDKQINVKPVQFKIINKTLPGQSQPTQISKQSFVVYPAAKNKQPVGPVYKIIIKDGKQLLKKVDTVPKNLKKVYNNDIDINNDNELCDTDVVDNENSFIVDNCEVKKITNINNIKSTTIDNTDNNNSDVNKSNDKENRDSRKKNDDKITTSSSSSSSSTAGTTTASDKKHSSQSSSSSKSKHSSSSSSRSSSSSHRSSSHRSGSSKSSSSSSSKSSRDRDRHHSSSSKHGSSSSSSSSRSKTDKDKEKDKDKDKDKKDQAEKDKATLEKIQGQSLSTKFGKIPKKKSDDDKNDTTLRKSSTDSRDSSKENKDNKKITSPSSSSSSSSNNNNTTTTTTTTNSNSNSILEKKNISISIENRKNSTDQPRPKTVKTFNSKFRSTGLEEEVKPPPSKSSIKKPNIINDNKKLFQPKLSLKRPSPLRDTPISDKKIKLSLEPPTPTGEEKKGAIKLIAPKPKPMVLQESDMFMDALMTASTKGKEPRKRKRRTSLTKDDKNDTKKSDGTNEQGGKDDESPASPPQTEKSPLPVKPDFKFYQDTLETDEDKEEKEKSQDDDESQDDNDKNRTNSGDDDDERSQTPTNDDDSSDKKHSPLSPDSEVRYVDGLRSVLVIQKRKGPKKLLKWNTELESIRYFELDETERVNVTKTFTDMKQMEKQGEREAFQMARKLSTEDTMEEKIKWRVLIPLDLPPALVDPGKDSKERDIQYAREKSILQALYFNRGMIPDSPAEPDEERHHIFKDPIIIPLDDLTGNKESEKDFSMLSWPEPKPKISIPPPSIIPQQQIITQNQQLHYQQFTQHNQMLPPNMQNGPMGVGITQQQIPPNIMSLNTINELNNTNTGIGGGGGWRTGDGKVVVPDVNIIGGGGGNNIPGQFVSGLDPLIMAPTMIPPPNLYHQQPPPDNFNGFMGNDDNNFGHMQNNFQGPPGIFNNNNNNNNFRGGGGSGGNNNNGNGGGNGVMMANRGRGGNIPVWFRGGPPGTGGPGGLPPGGPGGPGGPGPMRGVWNNGGRGNWRNNGKPVCRQFVKNGFCRVGDKCQYFHPGPNCPPF